MSQEPEDSRRRIPHSSATREIRVYEQVYEYGLRILTYSYTYSYTQIDKARDKVSVP